MTTIRSVLEAQGNLEPDYFTKTFTEGEISAGKHRTFVGGLWEDMGKLQIEYLKGQGLQPHHKVIDIGCGAFRAGRHLIEYLDPGNYYAIDSSNSVMKAGYDNELGKTLQDRQPLENLRSTDRFDVDFGVKFDFAIAQSVFTHISLNLIRLCLCRTARVLKPEGRFFATFFENAPGAEVDHIDKRGKRPKFYERNVFWYYPDDLQWAAQRTGLKGEFIGNWGHPRNQKMMIYSHDTAAAG